MSLQFHHQPNGPVEITLRGASLEKPDCQRLLRFLSSHPTQPTQIAFYDLRLAPPELIKPLASLLEQGSRLQIRAHHANLVHQLRRLDLPVYEEPRHFLNAANPSFDAIVVVAPEGSRETVASLVANLPKGGGRPLLMVGGPPEGLRPWLSAPATGTAYRLVEVEKPRPMAPNAIYHPVIGRHLVRRGEEIAAVTTGWAGKTPPDPDIRCRAVAEARSLIVHLCGAAPRSEEGEGMDGAFFLSESGEGGRKEPDRTVRRKRPQGPLPQGFEEQERHQTADKAPPLPSTAGTIRTAATSSPTLFALVSAAAAEDGIADDQTLSAFLTAIYDRYGYEYRGYDRRSLRRRILKLRTSLQLNDSFSLYELILRNPDVFEKLFLDLSINVSHFFRHPEQFAAMRHTVLPFLDSFPHIKIWSAGCSTGEEVYSLSITLNDIGVSQKSQILATDINPFVLEQARAALYSRETFEQDRHNYLLAGGNGTMDRFVIPYRGFVEMRDQVKERTSFHRHDLCQDGVFNEFQLILCRNTLIFLQMEQQREVLALFAQSLHRDGFLVLAPGEGITANGGEEFFVPFAMEQGIFRRKSQ